MPLEECATCGFENRPGALFCGSCGVRLGRKCPSCGDVISTSLAFCTSCGSELAPLASAPPISEERKVVSVLFADLVGFTGRAERLDPEDVRGLLAPYHARLKAELEGFGGTVEKFIGDAVMALFGAPRAHEDDPERALRAAHAIREAIGELNAADPSLDLQVRIGVTTGEAMITLHARPSEGEAMAAGDVVNAAARLQTAAPPGGILVDEPTYRATKHVVEFEERQPVRAKGKSQPIPVWEARALRTRLGVDIAFRGGAPLVGRRRELDLLLDARARAEGERTPQLVTVTGVPGIGKSRLLWELYARLNADPDVFLYWRQGRSLPYGEGVSFWALGEMVKSQAGILESDDAPTAEEKLRAAVDLLIADPGEARWVEGHLRPLVGLGAADTGGRQEEAFAAWRRFFEGLAEQRPLVLVFEDVHWADEGLLDFVDHLVDWATGVPLLVLCTARPELLERRPGWGGGKRNALTVSLSPLTEADTGELLTALLKRRMLPLERQSAILGRAGGNPLYAEEYVRMLTQPGAPAELSLPDSVQGIIAARLDTLPPDEKALLQDASVVGKVFWLGALAAVGGLPRELVEERLHALERKEFVRRERRSSVAGETAFVFRHVLVRDVAYGQIPRPGRAEKHRLAADWIESLAAGRSEDLADMVAHHYLSALQFARAAGQEAADLATRARRALEEAGDRALALNAFRSAARFYENALELWPEDSPERPRLLLRYGRALFHAEGTGADVLTEAAEELLDAGELEAAAEAHVVLGDLSFFGQGSREGAVEHLSAAAALLAGEPPSRAKVLVLANRARFHMIADEAEEAIRTGFEAFTMAEELGLDELRAHTLSTLGMARAMIGDPGGVSDLERSISISQALNSPETMRSYNNLGSLVASLGELERSYGLYEQARRSAERFGHALALQWLTAQRMDELFWTGRWDEAVEQADELIATMEGGAGRMQLVDAHLLRGRMRLARGDAAGALADSEEAAAAAREAKDPQTAFPALATRAHVLLATGQREEAGAVARELLETWGESRVTLPGPWLPELAVVLAALGREDDFEAAAARVVTPTKWLEAATAFVGGDPARSAGVYAEIGSRPDEAYARLRAAERLVAAGRRGEAEAQLTRALEFCRSVEAGALIREAEALLSPT